MTRTAATMVGRSARLALLLATALGLALMHTLGHTGVRADPHLTVSGMGATAMGTAVEQPCPDGHCDGHGGHGSGAWSACLAILTGLAVIVVLLWLLTAVGGRRLLPLPTVLRAKSPRAPPDHTTGLTLASAAVLRI
ncbi:DUF6153 family protein [Actinoplanes sp. NPDC051861]|uniref:DUF6153 family protein n=1 Tax=Actinoplanes sp. NPDC051861 TaxID=3155170 RepID=UPI003423DC87